VTTTRKQDPIKKITTSGGEVRYRFVIDMGKRADGGRDQRCFTFAKLTDARAARAKIISDRKAGTLIRPTKITVGELIDQWLNSRRNDLKPGTFRNYTDSLSLAKAGIGKIQVRDLTRAHVEKLVNDLRKSGRRVGNVQHQGLGPRSTNLMLTLLRAVLDRATQEDLVARNVAKMVKPAKVPQRKPTFWSYEQAHQFLEIMAADRLHAAWRLALFGLRRGELLGLRWSDMDLEAKTITICHTRTLVATEVQEGTTKTEQSNRTLQLDDGLVAALRALKTQQARERLEAGEAYASSCGLCGGSHVVVNELGEPYRPDAFSDRFLRFAQTAGLPRIRLHDLRTTAITLMGQAGVPIVEIQKLVGHSNPAITLRVYTKSQPEIQRRGVDVYAEGLSRGAIVRFS
jgi:integrase